MKFLRGLLMFQLFTQQKQSEKGVILVILAAAMIPLLGIAALSIDLGFAYLVTKQMKNAASLAALAAVKTFATKPASYQDLYDSARVVAEQNIIHINGPKQVQLAAGDLEVGTYDFTAKKFTKNRMNDPAIPGTNAVRANVRLAEDTNKPFTWKFAQVLGFDAPEGWQRHGVAVLGKRHFVALVDISASMDDKSYPSYFPNPTAECPSAVEDPYNDWMSRNFRSLPIASYNGTYCLGGKPQPMFDLFTHVRDSFLENTQLFNDANYRVGLITYGTLIDTQIELNKDDNRKEAQTFITKNVLDQLDAYRIAENPGIFKLGGGQIFPGGDDPLNELGKGSTGFTNTPQALESAISMLTTASQSTNVKTSNTIILLTDGEANCSKSKKPTCGNTTPHIAASKKDMFAQATTAGKNDIIIHALYYATNDSCPSAQGFKDLQQVAQKSGGQAYCATSIAEVSDIFTNLTLQPVFVLVE
ncbi:MAG: VWA domain-containing protein [Candidatus Omnitrophica bacterium]|nr:VWA domain-containing protein [Candidatus Omnitrophota bacterium]